VVKGPVPPTPVDRPSLPPDQVVIDLDPTNDPCAVTREIKIAADPLTPGTVVTAVPEGGRVALLADNRPIGWLSDDDGAAVRLCASRGWGFAGPVLGFDDGELIITLVPKRLT
jgi:hypothetical protein